MFIFNLFELLLFLFNNVIQFQSRWELVTCVWISVSLLVRAALSSRCLYVVFLFQALGPPHSNPLIVLPLHPRPSPVRLGVSRFPFPKWRESQSNSTTLSDLFSLLPGYLIRYCPRSPKLRGPIPTHCLPSHARVSSFYSYTGSKLSCLFEHLSHPYFSPRLGVPQPWEFGWGCSKLRTDHPPLSCFSSPTPHEDNCSGLLMYPPHF